MTSFHDRRKIPPKGKRRKNGERRVAWRQHALSEDVLSRLFLTSLENEEIRQSCDQADPSAIKNTSQEDPPIRKLDDRYPPSFRRLLKDSKALKTLESLNCDSQFIIGTCALLTFTPLEFWKITDRRREWGKPLEKASEIASDLRLMAALQPGGLYTDRELWLLQQLPELLEELRALVKKVLKKHKGISPHALRDLAVVQLGRHLREKTGRNNWGLLADLVGDLSVGLPDVSTLTDARTLARIDRRARERLRKLGNSSSGGTGSR